MDYSYKQIKAEMEILCAQRESANGLRKNDLENGWKPAGPVGNLEWGATYLEQIDSRWRRSYSIHSGGFSTGRRSLIKIEIFHRLDCVSKSESFEIPFRYEPEPVINT